MTPGRRWPTGSRAASPAASDAGPAAISGDAEQAVGPRSLLDQLAYDEACVQRILFARPARQLLQDLAAALRLAAQEGHVLGEPAVLLERVLELARDEHDRSKRRAELVRGRRREPVERVQLLLAREHQLGGGERGRHQPRLVRQPPDVEGEERHAGAHRDEHADLVEERHVQPQPLIPGQRPVVEHEQGGGGRHHQRAARCCAGAAWPRRP